MINSERTFHKAAGSEPANRDLTRKAQRTQRAKHADKLSLCSLCLGGEFSASPFRRRRFLLYDSATETGSTKRNSRGFKDGAYIEPLSLSPLRFAARMSIQAKSWFQLDQIVLLDAELSFKPTDGCRLKLEVCPDSVQRRGGGDEFISADSRLGRTRAKIADFQKYLLFFV